MKILHLSAYGRYFSIILGLVLLHGNLLAHQESKSEVQYRLDNVVILGTKSEHTLGDSPVSTALITKKDIERSNAKSISQLLGTIPGFNFSEQSDLMGAMGYKNTIRGLNLEDRYLLVLVDGQRVFSGMHAGGMSGAGFAHNVNIIPVSMIEKIEVIKGAGSSLYGSDAVVGVLNIITKKASDKLEAGAGITYGVYELSGADFLGQKAQDTKRTMISEYFNISGSVNEYVKLGLFASDERNGGIAHKKHKQKRDYIHLDSEIKAGDTLISLGGEYIKWSDKALKGSHHLREDSKRAYVGIARQIGDTQEVKVNAFYQNLDADFNDEIFGKLFADVSYKGGNLEHSLFYFDNHAIITGVEYIIEDFHTESIKKKSIKTQSLYLQDEIALLEERLILLPSARVVHNSLYGDRFVPKMNVAFHASDDWRLRIQAGKAFKAPLGLRMFANPVNHGNVWVLSNENLKPEDSFTWEVSVDRDMFEDTLLLSLTYYDMKVKDQVVQAPTGKDIGGIPVYTWKNINESEVRGIEAALAYELSLESSLNLAYTYTDSKDKSTGEELVYTPKHTANGSIDYENPAYGIGGMLSAAYRSSSLNIAYTPTSSPRTKSITTFGAALWKRFLTHGKLKLEVQNIFNKKLEGADMISVGRSAMMSFEYRY